MSLLSSYWDGFVEKIAEKEGKNSVMPSLLKQAKISDSTEDQITLTVVSQGAYDFLEKRINKIEADFFDHSQKKAQITFIVKAPSKKKITPPLLSFEPSIEDVFVRSGLNKKYNFDNFAVSSSNQMAHAAAQAVAASPGKAYNPLFLYGGVGVGKTHLGQAIAIEILKNNPQTKIIYCMGEEFTNEIIDAIQQKKTRDFRKRYREARGLFIDDIQFIAGKNTVQEEFFHTFNAVLREGGQVILTSDRSPGEISRLEDRLRSRFEGGLLVDISPPDFELRAAIVNIKSQAIGLPLSIDASRVIAANLTDTRAIEGFLKRLTTEVSTHKTELTPDSITALLSARGSSPSSTSPSSKKRVNPQEILEAVSKYYDIKSTALKGIKRDRPIARPRQLVMYLCKVELGLTLNDIGGMLGGRDHTTIMHGIDTITHELSTNEHLREAVVGIKKQLWV